MADKKLVRREPSENSPKIPAVQGLVRIINWYEQCGADLAAGRHAHQCHCYRDHRTWPDGEVTAADPENACTEIARRMLAFEGYSVEVEG